ADPLQVGVNLAAGMPTVLSQLNTALASTGLQFTNSGSTLNLLGSPSATVQAASVTTTAQSLTSGNPQLSLFTDGNSLYTGQITSSGLQMTGLAGRISVNAAVVADPSALSVYSTSPQTATGDNTRSDFLFSQLTSAKFNYAPSTGLGSAAQPFNGTVTSY